MDDMPMLRPPGNSSEIPAVRHARIATARMFRRPWSVRRSGYTRRVALRPFRWAVKLNSGMVVSFLSLGFLALILPRKPSPKGRNRSRSDEAEQVDGGGVPGDGPAPGGPVCPAAGAHRLPAVTAVPPGLCGVGLGGLRDGGGHVAEAGGP